MDCLPLIVGAQKHVHNKHVYMKMKKSAYGLYDAPLLWFEEAASRLLKRQCPPHPLDKCCFMRTNSKTGQPNVMLILHVDDMLLTGDARDTDFQEALKYFCVLILIFANGMS